jgi:Zn-dependent protease
MVSYKEKQARIQEFFRFSRQEVLGIVAAVLITAFVFSFRDWGIEQFNAITGLRNLLIMIIIVAITFIVRLSIQKMNGLTEGYKADFKVWWSGLGVALILAFVSLGKIPLALIGTMANSFMVKQRLGEFRYGFSYGDNAAIASIGVFVNLGLATLAAVGLYFLPNSYIFSKSLILNMVMATTSLIPVRQMDGLHIFFGNRNGYFILLGLVPIFWLLLLSKTRIGLVIGVIVITLLTIFGMLRSSDK